MRHNLGISDCLFLQWGCDGLENTMTVERMWPYQEQVVKNVPKLRRALPLPRRPLGGLEADKEYSPRAANAHRLHRLFAYRPIKQKFRDGQLNRQRKIRLLRRQRPTVCKFPTVSQQHLVVTCSTYFLILWGLDVANAATHDFERRHS